MMEDFDKNIFLDKNYLSDIIEIEAIRIAKVRNIHYDKAMVDICIMLSFFLFGKEKLNEAEIEIGASIVMQLAFDNIDN